MSKILLCIPLLFSGCGSGGFKIGNDRYAPSGISAEALHEEAIDGVRVTIRSQGTHSVGDDSVAVNVTLYWSKLAPPAYEQELKLDNEGSYRATVDVDCRCAGLVKPLALPKLTGKFKLEKFDDKTLRGWFDVKFAGDIALTTGGVGFENSQVTANASFEAPRPVTLAPR